MVSNKRDCQYSRVENNGETLVSRDAACFKQLQLGFLLCLRVKLLVQQSWAFFADAFNSEAVEPPVVVLQFEHLNFGQQGTTHLG